MSTTTDFHNKYEPIELDASVPEAIRNCRIMHPAYSDALHRILSHFEMGSPKRIVSILGVSGTGKTTLREQTYRLINKKILKSNTGLPAVSFSASPPEGSTFSFRVFYEQFLHELNEPLSEYKMDPQERLEQLQENPGVRINRSTAAARFALEKILRTQPPAAALVDESQHLGRNVNLAQCVDHMDVLKSMSEVGTTKWILFGTLQAQRLQHLNGQLSRRIKAITIRPYDPTEKGVQDYWSTFVTLCTRLRLPTNVGTGSAVYLRRATGGTVGLLSEWMQEAVEEAIFDKASQLELCHLEATQPAQETLDLIADEIYEHDCIARKRKKQLQKKNSKAKKKAKAKGNSKPGRRKPGVRDKAGLAA